jgi:hypothetical protein
MDLFQRLPRWSVVLVLSAFVVGCTSRPRLIGSRDASGPVAGSRPEGAPGGRGGGTGGAPGDAPPAATGPTFTLPDAGVAPVTPAARPDPGQSCAEEAHQAKIVPVDLLLLVDSSNSMEGLAGLQSKWVTIQMALGAFIRDPRSGGLGVGMQFFPNFDKPCASDGDCVPGLPDLGLLCQDRRVCAGPSVSAPGPRCGILSSRGCAEGTICVAEPAPAKICFASLPPSECELSSYQNPTVPIGSLPAAEAPLLGALGAKGPLGETPMGPAVGGALAYLRAHLGSSPGRKAVLIVASDGVPFGCDSSAMNDIPSIAANLAAAFSETPSIPTHVIGVFAPAEVMMSRPELDKLAAAGGSNQAIILEADADLSQRLQEALDQIRGAALACDFEIPAPSGRIDFARVNVRYSAGGSDENVPYVESPDRCDPVRGGWYYDVVPAMGVPERVLMCGVTCRRFQSAPDGKVELVFGCATQVID